MTKATCAAQYPFGLLAVPRSRARPRPRLERHPRQADRRRLHPRRPRDLDRADGALHVDGRRAGRDDDPQRQWLRAVHRRPRLPPGRGAASEPRSSRSRAGAPRARRCCCNDLAPEVLVATPSYALVIAQALRESGVDPASLPLELGLFGGEPWSEPMRAEIDRALGLRAVNFYGLSEMCGPGVATECLMVRAGLHVSEDHFLVEVDRPRQRPAGAPGRRGRARVHDADQGGAAADPLPHRRHRPPARRAVRVRAHHRPADWPARPRRRHADHPRRQPLPLAGRARAAEHRRRGCRTTA